MHFCNIIYLHICTFKGLDIEIFKYNSIGNWNLMSIFSSCRPKRSYGSTGWVCLSVCTSVTALLQRVQNHMSKGNKESQSECRNASQALMTSLYIQSTLKRDLFYTLLINLCLEKQWIIYYAQWRLYCTGPAQRILRPQANF